MKIETVKDFLWKYNPVTVTARVVQNSFICIPREMKIMNIAISLLAASAITFRPYLHHTVQMAANLDNCQIFVISGLVTLAALTLISGIGATLICANHDFTKRECRNIFKKTINIIF